MKQDERAKKIERALSLAWDSLESHTAFTYKHKDKKFHQTCVTEYAEMIFLISQLYE